MSAKLAEQRIEKFDKDVVQGLRPVVEEALAAALAKYGLTVDVGRITYGETSFSAKVEFATGNDAESEFKKYATILGYQPDWFGKTFELQGENVKVIGVEPGKPKFPIQIQNEAGKVYGYTVDALRLALGDKEAVLKEFRRKTEIEDRQCFIWEGQEHNLNPAWLGQEVHLGKEAHKIIGLRKKGKKLIVVFSDNRSLDLPTFLWAINQDVNKPLREMPKAKTGDVFVAQSKIDAA
jgi:hypothetical protein